MNSKLKWVAIAVGVLLVILFVLPFLIPVNKFRPTIEAKASEALGRKVQLGNLSLSILGGSLGIDSISVSDDPKFSSGPFLTAKSVKVGVELMPLIFSQQVNVTGIEIVKPEVVLLKGPNGQWNFSSLGGGSSGSKSASSSGSGAQSIAIKKLELKDGQITLGNSNSQKRSVYAPVNLTASDVAMSNKFPVEFLMGLPGGGTLKVEGNVGPVDQKDAADTPQDTKLTLTSLDLAKTGFLDPSLGLGGVVGVAATLVSQGGEMSTKGQLTLSKAILVAGGEPSGVPLNLDFNTKYNIAKGAGVLNPSTVSIGSAKSNLSGTYKSEGDDFVVDLKLDSQGMPATDLESFLPALGINLPTGSKLTAGTLSTNLHITGPTNKLVTDGNVGLYKGTLSGFDLGSKMSGVASLAGIKTGKDLDIEKMTTNINMAPTGLTASDLDLVVTSLGTVVGGGTLDSKNNLDFKLVATVESSIMNSSAGGAMGGATGGVMSGALGSAMGGGSNCKNGGIKVPLQIHGTTKDPKFTPDLGGVAANLLKAQLGCAGGTGGAATGALGSLVKNPQAGGALGGLGGLFGGKKKP